MCAQWRAAALPASYSSRTIGSVQQASSGAVGPTSRLACAPCANRHGRALPRRLEALPSQTSQAAIVSAPPASVESAVVRELNAESFYSFLEESGDAIVVVDFYTDWCGPCQLMHKELDKLTAAFKQVRFGKVNCAKCDQPFSSRHRIKSLPTFRLYHRGTCLDEVTGAKPVQLRQLLTHYSCMLSL